MHLKVDWYYIHNYDFPGFNSSWYIIRGFAGKKVAYIPLCRYEVTSTYWPMYEQIRPNSLQNSTTGSLLSRKFAEMCRSLKCWISIKLKNLCFTKIDHISETMSNKARPLFLHCCDIISSVELSSSYTQTCANLI